MDPTEILDIDVKILNKQNLELNVRNIQWPIDV